MSPLYTLLLDLIERREVVSLKWGYVDGSLSHRDVISFAQDVISSQEHHVDDDPEDLLSDLLERRLVFRIAGGKRYRSRFAETVRLLSRLRQLFPNKPWYGAPKLISDFHVDVRPRRYPCRNRDASVVNEENPEIIRANPLRVDLWHALTQENPHLVFSVFQEKAILRLLSLDGDSGTIITSGTGSGKTLAFYLPAFLKISDHIQPQQYWVKTLAVYPRIELLKDQFSEAFQLARRIDGVLKSHKRRPLLIGAFFGSTPHSAASINWATRGSAFVCPWFKCPVCGSDLLWLHEDRTANRERLTCSSPSCQNIIDESQIILTRNRLAKSPPDILFTTTEMLNQRMSDIKFRRVFGLGMPYGKRPLFALLDEVHTYTGTTGAQTALVLRRWRHLVATQVVWCGLSATLQEAKRFFSDLSGVRLDNVEEITPLESEFISEGAEYQIVLRGDPMLQASLLSSTIQVAMLLSRMMDPRRPLWDGGLFGRRLFVFTDNLDVINRLFDSLRDAEAYNIFGRPDNRRQPLAFLRGGDHDDKESRARDGQLWTACARINQESLRQRLCIGRTSSQDAGVMSDADVIVATASLEVGYNDDQVGGVVQHKAPRNMASFLQRKGRAGRVRGMRPITVTVLSDYGRDRLAFQAYESLFDPELAPQYLPIKNQYVLRMQAVFSLFDWLTLHAPGNIDTGWLWDVLSRPQTQNYPSPIRPYVLDKLNALVDGDVESRSSLEQHLLHSLDLDKDIIDSIMWEPPRSIMLEVIPTLLRRLTRNWVIAYRGRAHRVTVNKLDLCTQYHPLPDFIPRNLFSDLNLPEVQIEIPPPTQNGESKSDALPILRSLNELAPGRVTRRFATQRGQLSHWIPIDQEIVGGETDQCDMPIADYAERSEFLGVFDGLGGDGQRVAFPVYRPWVMRVVNVGNAVLPTSNSIPVWNSSFLPVNDPLVVDVPPRSSWRDYVDGVKFYLHHFRSSLVVRRFSPSSDANLRLNGGQERNIKVRYVDERSQPAAVGFELDVDGFSMDFRLPSASELVAFELSPPLIASSRRAYHRYRFMNDKELPSWISSLLKDWIHQIFLSAVISRALTEDRSLGKAALLLLEDPIQSFEPVMAALFQMQDISAEAIDQEDENAIEDDSTDAERVTRLEQRLKESFAVPEVIQKLKELAPELDDPDPNSYGKWLRHTLHETLGEAVLQACINVAPSHAATDTLVADLEWVEDGEISRVWITETTVGGAGVIRAFADEFTNNPKGLFYELEAALVPTDLELSSDGLNRFVSLACDDEIVRNCTAKLRSCDGHKERKEVQDELNKALALRGIDLSHSFSVSLNTRLLQPGMGLGWDKLLKSLIELWDQLEAKFSMSIGSREFSYLTLTFPDIQEQVIELLQDVHPDINADADRMQALEGLLWPRGMDVRQRTLQSYNPYRQRRVTDPALVRTILLSRNTASANIAHEDWYKDCCGLLSEYGSVELVATPSTLNDLKAAIIKILVQPIDVGYLLFYPVLERVQRNAVETRVTFSLREHL